ncbi:MAG TPA: hypothetical protein VK883_04380, partial [Arthrobacter sp.]|nr:hypothetical protein [Arthrobacter sp.]
MTELADRPAGSAKTVPAKTPASPRTVAAPGAAGPAVDVAALGELLLGKWAETRRTARTLAGRP